MKRYFGVVVIVLASLFLCGYTYQGEGGYTNQGGYTPLEGTPGYLSAARGGGNVPVFGDLDAIQYGLSRGDPISAMDQNKISDALDGTLVVINEESRTHMGWVGDFMKVTILDGDCQGKEGWAEIKNIRKRLH